MIGDGERLLVVLAKIGCEGGRAGTAATAGGWLCEAVSSCIDVIVF